MYRLPMHRAGVAGEQRFAGNSQPLPADVARVIAQDCGGRIFETLANRIDGRLVVWCECGYPIPVCEHDHFVAHIQAGEIVSTECLDCDLIMPERVAS